MKCNNSFAHGISITQTYECLELNAGDCPYCKIEALEKVRDAQTLAYMELMSDRDTLREALERIAQYDVCTDSELLSYHGSLRIAREALQRAGGGE